MRVNVSGITRPNSLFTRPDCASRPAGTAGTATSEIKHGAHLSASRVAEERTWSLPRVTYVSQLKALESRGLLYFSV